MANYIMQGKVSSIKGNRTLMDGRDVYSVLFSKESKQQKLRQFIIKVNGNNFRQSISGISSFSSF